MKIKLDCFPCLFRQTLKTARVATDDEKIIRVIMNYYAQLVPEISQEITSPEVAGRVQKKLREIAGQDDPYHEYKQKNIELALSYYPEVKKIVEEAEEPLAAALVISALGNTMDAGVDLEMDVEKNIKQAARQKFAKTEFDLFRKKLDKSEKVIFIADNAGEAVFDKLLLEVLNRYGVEITYAVREEPILNDVTVSEARQVGIDEIGEIVSTGNSAPGLILKQTSAEFKDIYRQADLRISKGQGNLECLTEAEEEFFFLLKAKCGIVADFLGVEMGELVFVSQ